MQKSADVMRPGTDSTQRVEEVPVTGRKSRLPVIMACVSGLPVSNLTVSMAAGGVGAPTDAVGGTGAGCGWISFSMSVLAAESAQERELVGGGEHG